MAGRLLVIATVTAVSFVSKRQCSARDSPAWKTEISPNVRPVSITVAAMTSFPVALQITLLQIFRRTKGNGLEFSLVLLRHAQAEWPAVRYTASPEPPLAFG